MAAIFLYPKIDKVIGSPNPYVFNFQKALAKNHLLVNAKSPNRGILSFFIHFFKTDLFILNWPETIPEKKFGGLQKKLFEVFLQLNKLFSKKIVWVLHNKGSHHKGENPVTLDMFNRLMRVKNLLLPPIPGLRKKYMSSLILLPTSWGIIRRMEKNMIFLYGVVSFPIKE